MNKLNKAALIAATLVVVSATANASIVPITYIGITNGNPGGPPTNGNIALSSATWTWDTVTNDIVATGTVSNRFFAGPPLPANNVFTHNLSGFSISGAGVASASSYTCTNGAFAVASLNRNVCAGYNFGPNTTNESTVSGDGTVVTLLGGDDFLSGTPQTLANNFNMDSRIFTGFNTMLVRKSTYNPAVAGNFQLSFVVPIPAAVWLFGSALGLMGLARRQKAAA